MNCDHELTDRDDIVLNINEEGEALNPGVTCSTLAEWGLCDDELTRYICPLSCPSDPELKADVFCFDNDAMVDVLLQQVGTGATCEWYTSSHSCHMLHSALICPESCASLGPRLEA